MTPTWLESRRSTRRVAASTSLVAAITLPLLLAGCGDDTTSAPADSTSTAGDGDTVSVAAPATDRTLGDTIEDSMFALRDGAYDMVGYGTVLVADGEEVTPHYVTPSTCTVGESFDNEIDVDHAADDGGQIIVDLVGSTTDYRLRPLVDAPNCDSGPGDALTALDEVFTSHYPFFDERYVDWSTSIAAIRHAVDNGEATVRQALGAFMLDLGDGHTLLPDLDVDIDVATFGVDEVGSTDELATMIDVELDAALHRLGPVGVDDTGNVAWGHLADDPTTGYLFIGSFMLTDEPRTDRDALVTALDEAIADLATAERVIVDMRFNSGGFEDLAVVAAGYFVDEPVDTYRKWAHAEPDPLVQTITVTPQAARYDGDVTILTSPITASAAEAFLLAMRSATDATIVGTPSFGEFSDAIDWQLPDGTEFTMSMEVYTDLDGTNFEATGIPVDVVAPFDTAIDVALATT